MTELDRLWKRWRRLPKVRREQALYDVRFKLGMLRSCAKEGCKRDRGTVVLYELFFASAGIPTEHDPKATK